VFFRSLASEFPHDNPALSEGVVWTCPSPCARPLPLREPEMAAPGMLVMGPPGTDHGLTPESKREPERARPSVVKAAPRPVAVKPEPAPVPPDPFARLVQALSDVALNLGATRVAAVLPSLFTGGGADIAPRARELIEVGTAWRDVLCGTTSDLSACGARMLDEWGAELLNELLGRPASAARELRQRLRERGVAAFGFRDAA
jgi:hypothetical protein